ncbi:hypothetical protein HMPREF9145_0142 [Segatella salivae F0493]|uniref:Uncharacterized protein n=1 Tax=Segatella salivae F0493 TaxID=1395125 RepID=U2MJC9_9BACT|nr:hypothetical protein HMPREF9145_0142 [Segatella salivae F0493]
MLHVVEPVFLNCFDFHGFYNLISDKYVSGCPESLFFKILRLRDAPKACFSNFSSFGTPRKLVFQIFRASGPPDGSFSQKTARRGIPKPYFSEFLSFGMPRSMIFPVFRVPNVGTNL